MFVCDALAGGRDCPLEYNCFTPLKKTQVPLTRALRDPDQIDCYVDTIRATAVTASSSVRKAEQRKSSKSDVSHASNITAGCSSGHVFSVEFLRSQILRPQVICWSQNGQWSLVRGYAEQESALNPSAALALSLLNADKAARGTSCKM
jgi:hypothetical protein